MLLQAMMPARHCPLTSPHLSPSIGSIDTFIEHNLTLAAHFMFVHVVAEVHSQAAWQWPVALTSVHDQVSHLADWAALRYGHVLRM